MTRERLLVGPAGSNEEAMDQQEGSEGAMTGRHRNRKTASFMFGDLHDEDPAERPKK